MSLPPAVPISYIKSSPFEIPSVVYVFLAKSQPIHPHFIDEKTKSARSLGFVQVITVASKLRIFCPKSLKKEQIELYWSS